MSETGNPASGLIGPNAILQVLPVIERFGGPERCSGMLARAGLRHIPHGDRMIPETDAARLHRQLRREEPDMAPALSHEAGIGTANYILRHRIPRPAQWLLRALPPAPAARLLSRAIAQHAWTFVGSGRLVVADAWSFEIEANPLIAGETSDACLCHWHAGVFARLYQVLVAQGTSCTETCCGAQHPGNRCRFELRRVRL